MILNSNKMYFPDFGLQNCDSMKYFGSVEMSNLVFIPFSKYSCFKNLNLTHCLFQAKDSQFF